jgi:hypothetical protein
MRRTTTIMLVPLLFLPGLLTLAGCNEEIEPESTAVETDTTETVEDDAPRPASGLGDNGRGGALAGAKRAAKNTVGKLENRDKEIQRELEDDD